MGPAGAPLAREAAAVLACRPRAFLGDLTAARIWVLPAPASDGIDVTVVARRPQAPQGVRVRWITHLPAAELRWHQGLPVASPSLTLLDLAGRVRPGELATALNEARVQKLVTDRELHATIEAHPRRRGVRALRRLLATERGPRITRSVAERRALKVMRAHGIKPDRSDVRIGPYRVDFLFEREKLVVEVDGYRYHATPKRFRDDRRRTAYLTARGLVVFPLTWDDLGPEADRAMTNLAEALSERR